MHQGTFVFEAAKQAEERWLPIEGWPGYDVSDWGRVRSWWTHVGKTYRGPLAWGDQPKVLSPTILPNGRLYVTLSRNQSKERRQFTVHKLVLTTFVGPRPVGMEACHDPDPNPKNCRLANLRWGTKKENAEDRHRHGPYSCRQKLEPTDIPVIWGRLVQGDSCAKIARDYGVTKGAISEIREGKTWSHITKKLVGTPAVKQPAIDTSDIPAIWARLVAGEPGRLIARDYGIDERDVSAIKTRRRWRSITSCLPGVPLKRRQPA